ncbi:adenylyl-sulfate kinase 3-like isoform X1 [Magnolia sinica]|uniref:adenylyl-sulfate kinase 3-like isoform X1 n=1 Tax=Magnolia sinica TaxID=86752 RepID=UPI002659E78D|nr:adenylyl-sulfate kinase 3-like isoform X1 [Magnolia sinica]
MISVPARSLLGLSGVEFPPSPNLGFLFSSFESSSAVGFDRKIKGLGIFTTVRLKFSPPMRAKEESRTAAFVDGKGEENAGRLESGSATKKMDGCDCASAVSGTNGVAMSTVGKSTNIVWQECSVGKLDRQKLLGQKGCVLWITGLSGSGKSTLACALSQGLHGRGKLTYILDGDNVRHGLNRDLSFKAEDRAENIRRIGEVAKLFADAGVICIASLISPYRRDRDACRALLPEGQFIEVFMNVPLEVCEARDAKGLYKLARAGKITGFTGIDDPYEPPLDCEIELHQENDISTSPSAMAEQVISYLEEKGFLQA